MKKIAILSIILLVISVTILSGCEQQEITDKPDNEVPDIINQSPKAYCSANPTEGKVPLLVSFTGTGVDTDGTIISYHWDFDDGTSSTEQNPTHTFQLSGTYTVILTVTDNEGDTGSDYIQITTESRFDDDAFLQWITDVNDMMGKYNRWLQEAGESESWGLFEFHARELENLIEDTYKPECLAFHLSFKYDRIRDEYYSYFEDWSLVAYYSKLAGISMQKESYSQAADYLNLATDYLNQANEHERTIVDMLNDL